MTLLSRKIFSIFKTFVVLKWKYKLNHIKTYHMLSSANLDFQNIWPICRKKKIFVLTFNSIESSSSQIFDSKFLLFYLWILVGSGTYEISIILSTSISYNLIDIGLQFFLREVIMFLENNWITRRSHKNVQSRSKS